ncbi:hypothetical protein I315_02787 [Cryptococcus gattii Ru294]|uniref:ATP synthase F(0) complex subunit e, mitochondrial n=5 Tax=Cryptococcus gattii species complex TaxID=1884637 RepID=A0A0D0V5S6_9TREE|nr:hypothetical protein CNBG_2301 [Cryptococcus deuterogattii R265]KIR27622.1 hypothetical protein I309_03545 [Cryptococcus deuterogattii LA55]KIR33292.1 hypothetical protein I352_04059 [Cryptococcus deuterogattii MMRL2647]KIR41964.1 hypothetical protein I313_02126 [Cryptococcus deuterogattii Ram5]KIR49217.1 hypothetical protein I312_01370 [Cryptococcus bacillisporus CA1280]KIR54904.1 hypothetical protein I315_02787 [Cryptococcus gattii Ru294]KIR68131.1 hypothetical protein I314_01625 [Crypto|eukprot:KIR68131.1 hypothetical protein I314_01625 [Cryptococcus gattii CA1873]
MATPTVNVVRWSALIAGITYGIFHQSTLQAKYDEDKAKHHAAHRAHLVEEAKKAYAAKKAAKSGGSSLITDPEDPKFDLEKVIESWTKDS